MADPAQPLPSTTLGGEVRLIPVEIESLSLLYQHVNVMADKLIKGQECLMIRNVQVRLLLKAHHVVDVVNLGNPDPKRIPSHVKKLLALIAKVQFLGVIGWERPPGETLANYTEEEAKEEEMSRRCVTVLDLRLFAHSLRSLHLKHMDVKRGVVGVCDVVELILTDTTFDCSLKAFSSLRSVNFDRCALQSKNLATLCYSLRSFSVSMYQRHVDPPMWRQPADDELLEGMVPWESLSYVSIRGSRGIFRMDNSWGELNQLRHLSVTHVQLTTLKTMEAVSRCGNLVSIDVSHNKIDSLQSLSNIGPQLVKLNMSYNRLNDISGISNLAKLRELNVEGNDVNSWVDIRDIADGCQRLIKIVVKGNPMTRLGKLGAEDVNPFCASIFQFRSGLTVDGESTAGAKSKANPKFLTRFLPLFSKLVVDDDFDRRSQATGVSTSMISSSHRNHRSASRGPNATSNHLGEPRDSSHRGRSSRSRPSQQHADPLVGKRSKMVLDRAHDEGAVLPPEPSELPENAEDAIFRRLNTATLKEKYGEKWQEQALILAGSAYRDFQGIPEPLPDEAPPKRKKSPSTIEESVERPTHTRRRRHKSHRHGQQETTADAFPASPIAAAPSSPATAGGGGMTAGGFRQISDEGEGIAREQMTRFRDQLREQANRAQTTVDGIPRKEIEKQPTGTFASFLEGVQANNWQVDDTNLANGGGSGKKKNVFVGSGVDFQKSQLCEENFEMWDLEDVTTYDLGPSAMEVMLYDNVQNPGKVRNRFENKTLFKLVDQCSGYNRYVKLYAKVGPKMAKGSTSITTSTTFARPMMSIVIGGIKEPTQPVELGIDVLPSDEAQLGGGVMSATRRSGFFASESTRIKGDNDEDFIVEGGGAADRQMFRVTKPRVLACFLVPNGAPTRLFADYLANHLKACHSRLCVSGITHLWPRTFQAGGKGLDDPLKVQMDVGYIREKATNGKLYKEMNLGRQRVGTNLAVKGEDLFLTLQTYVFDSKLITKENTKLITYTNLLDEAENANGDIMEWEESVLLIVTNSNILIANDRNERRGNVKNPAEYFPDCRHQPLSCLSEIEVDYDLQSLKLDFSMDLLCKLKTRDRGVTLSILGAILSTKEGRKVDIHVRPCRIPFVISVPIAFVVGVFVRPPKLKTMKRVKDHRCYPLRETKEEMIPVRLILTASEVALVKDPNMDEPLTPKYMQPYTESEMSKMEVCRRTLSTMCKIRVAGPELFPLTFGFEFGEGIKKEVWSMTAQHPNAIQAIEAQVRRIPGVKVSEMSLREHQGQ